jgi:hypothetical protein
MIADTTALGLDATWWTALATIIALGLGLWGIFGPSFTMRITRPTLRLCFSDLAVHSERIDDTFHLRVPVANAEGKVPATDVEVFLLSITQEHVPHPIQMPTYLPIRLVWAHGGHPVVDRIAGGTKRLLDLGHLAFTINSASSLSDAIFARIDQANPVSLGFNLEIIPTAGRIGLPMGSYKLKFLISCSECTIHQSAVFTVRNRHLEDGNILADYLHIE